MAFAIFEKEYEIETGTLRIRIDYDKSYTNYNLDFDLVKVAKERYGYEDDDRLTFYPNTWEFEFDDLDKHNYHVLKLSVGEYSALLPENYTKYGGVTIWKDGVQIFKGYIDPLTLEQNNEDRSVKFEAMDVSKGLADISVEPLQNTDFSNILWFVYQIYKKVYPNLAPFPTTNSNFSNGILFRHDWIFKGNNAPAPVVIDQYRYWNNISDVNLTYFHWASMGLFGDGRPAQTYKDLLKLLALQFGMSIGTISYNKVYMIKRFNVANPNPINLDEMIVGEAKRYLHLPHKMGARNINNWNGTRYYTAGNVETLNGQIDGELRYPKLVDEFSTYIGSYNDPGSAGTSIFASSTFGEFPVFNGVFDPALNFPYEHIGRIIAEWMFRTRARPKDRIELTADGLSYNMFDYYYYTEAGNPTTTFRPMTIEKDHLKDQTEIVGIEI